MKRKRPFYLYFKRIFSGHKRNYSCIKIQKEKIGNKKGAEGTFYEQSFELGEEMNDSHAENTMEDEPNYIPETGVNEEQQMYDDDNYKEALQEDT